MLSTNEIFQPRRLYVRLYFYVCGSSNEILGEKKNEDCEISVCFRSFVVGMKIALFYMRMDVKTLKSYMRERHIYLLMFRARNEIVTDNKGYFVSFRFSFVRFTMHAVEMYIHKPHM